MTRRRPHDPLAHPARRTKTVTRRVARRAPPPPPEPPTITRLGFRCYRLVYTFDREPDAPPYAAIELRETRNTMGIFAFGPRAIRRAA